MNDEYKNNSPSTCSSFVFFVKKGLVALESVGGLIDWGGV